MSAKAKQNVLEVAIIGAGFSGVGMGIALTRAGRKSFIIFEKSNGISGTWHDNTYPGAGCDVPSHLYCYSFAPNPNWSRVFSRQSEIKSYVEDCAQRYGITGNIRLNTNVTSITYDEGERLWKLTTDEGEVIYARFVISATGPLSVPFIPPIKGMKKFKGRVFHSARWPDDLALDGKSVTIIGSAASAVQIAPAIADQVASLTIFQRTANYIVPRRDRAWRESEKARWRRFPFLLRLKRAFMDLSRDLVSFRAFRKNSLLARLLANSALNTMHDIVHDADLRAKLTPDYPLGCKRILLSDDYYQTLLRGNVALVTEGIASLESDRVCTASGREIPADILVLATGFKATQFTAGLDIIGRGGQKLHKKFEKRLQGYRGVSYTGFPNFFTILGPNTGLGHSSMILIIEAQINYILAAIEQTRTGAIDVREDAERRYNEGIARDLKNMVWSSGCKSWYQAEDGTIPTLWPHSTATFRAMMARPSFEDYRFSD